MDKYLEKIDDGGTCFESSTIYIADLALELEPRRQRTDRVDLFVDLGATLEDHGEACACVCQTTRDSLCPLDG